MVNLEGLNLNRMKKLLLIAVSFFTLNLSAQVSITSANTPSSGDTLRYSTALLDTTIFFNFEASGANLTWNFDSLNPFQQDVFEFVASSQTPYSNQVSNRIGLRIADTLSLGVADLYDVYNFYESTSASFSIDHRGATAPSGLGFNVSIAPSYSDKDEVFQFPLDYLDRDSSTFNFTFSNIFPPVYYSSSGYRINEVDAWGTLTTPYGTFNCIRVVTDIVTYDTVSFNNTNFGINSHVREYKWLTPQLKIPALTINGNVINVSGEGIFIPTSVDYRDSVRDIPPLIPTLALFATDETTVSEGDTVVFDNFSIGQGSVRSQWEISPNTFSYVNGTSATSRQPNVVFSDTGFYDVLLIATARGDVDSLNRTNYIQVINTTGLKEFNEDLSSRVTVYPNPTDEGSTITIGPFPESTIERVEIINVKGALVGEELLGKSLKNLTIQSPNVQGIYFLKVYTDEGLVVKKLLVE